MRESKGFRDPWVPSEYVGTKGAARKEAGWTETPAWKPETGSWGLEGDSRRPLKFLKKPVEFHI